MCSAVRADDTCKPPKKASFAHLAKNVKSQRRKEEGLRCAEVSLGFTGRQKTAPQQKAHNKGDLCLKHRHRPSFVASSGAFRRTIDRDQRA